MLIQKKIYGLIFMFFFATRLIAQPAYNNCSSALEICPNQTFSLTNIGANVTFCPNCEDDFNFCFTTQNSIWLFFNTNTTGGDVQIDFQNLIFESNPGQDTELQATILEAIVPCDAATYSQIGTCSSNESGNFSLLASGLPSSTTYYVVIDGDNTGAGISSPAECRFDIVLSGTGVDRPIPSINVVQNTTSICMNDTVNFSATLLDCPDNTAFKWYVNDTLRSTTSEPAFVTTELMQGDVVSVRTSCFNLCVDTVEGFGMPMDVYSFYVNAGEDIYIEPGEKTILNGETTAPLFFWSPSFLLNNPNTLSPLAFPKESTYFTLTATENGCTLSDQVLVGLNKVLDIPNTFSPNDDGTNDKWIIDGIEELYPNCQLEIYDRWGQMVFQSSGYSETKAWDGSSPMGKATEGVYFYILELRDEEKSMLKGNINLIR